MSSVPPWQLVYDDEAVAQLSDLSPDVRERIITGIETFSRDGHGDVKQLKGYKPPVFRLRIGDYRIFHVFEFDAGGATLFVVQNVFNRREAY